jgi:hypothetical protein
MAARTLTCMPTIARPGRKVVVLDGIVKKQDKIPKDTLRRVRKYRRDVLEKKTGES